MSAFLENPSVLAILSLCSAAVVAYVFRQFLGHRIAIYAHSIERAGIPTYRVHLQSLEDVDLAGPIRVRLKTSGRSLEQPTLLAGPDVRATWDPLRRSLQVEKDLRGHCTWTLEGELSPGARIEATVECDGSSVLCHPVHAAKGPWPIEGAFKDKPIAAGLLIGAFVFYCSTTRLAFQLYQPRPETGREVLIDSGLCLFVLLVTFLAYLLARLRSSVPVVQSYHVEQATVEVGKVESSG